MSAIIPVCHNFFGAQFRLLSHGDKAQKHQHTKYKTKHENLVRISQQMILPFQD